MQRPKPYSLNAVRVFTSVAHHASIVGAARDLGVSPSAISHQIKNLEDQIGIPLFERKNNAIRLTEAGQHLQNAADMALTTLDQSITELQRNENEVTIQVGVSIAVRWFIPALEILKQRHPELKIRVETTNASAKLPDDPTSLSIIYLRSGQAVLDRQLLIADESRPVIAPSLLKNSGYKGLKDFAKLPAIGATNDDWDWHHWADQVGVPMEQLSITDHFGSDDAAIHGAVAGLGMALTPPILTQKEIRSGALVEVPGFQPVVLGGYYLTTGRHENRATRIILNWLRKHMAHRQ